MIDATRVRERFPALKSSTVFLDNPAGTQVARDVVQAMSAYLIETNANSGGAFPGARASDALVEESRADVAAFLGAPRPEEIVFGQNMTTLTLHLSRCIARTLAPGDEVVVTRLDHDANIAPWLLAAEDRGCVVKWLDFDPARGTWSADDLARLVGPRTRVVAVGWASNALGSVNDVVSAVRIARDAGALSFVDAVHWAPHGPIDVAELDCDFLACSAYKFFGPHLGILYGRYELLDRLAAYRVRPAPSTPPGSLETGTQSFEAIAGVAGALRHIAWIGETFGTEPGAPTPEGREALTRGMRAIRAHETTLTRALLTELGRVPGLTIHGIADPERPEARVPTVSFTLEGWHPRRVVEELAARSINAWDGNYYALAVTERLGLEDSGGMVRVGAVHYNTLEEIGLLGETLQGLVRGRSAAHP